jgi:hypothetical protein
MTIIKLVIFAVIFFFAAEVACAQTTNTTMGVETLILAHKASREAIQTLHCRVSYSRRNDVSPSESPGPIKGEFWSSDKAVRLKVTQHGEELDHVWFGNLCKCIIRRKVDGREQIGAQVASFADRFFHPRADPYQIGILVLNLPGTADFLTVERLAERATGKLRVDEKLVEGRKIIAIEMVFEPSKIQRDRWKLEVQFDPVVNFLVSRTIYTGFLETGTLVRDESVQEFKEAAPGLFFPTRVVGRGEMSGKPWTSHVAEISDVEINRLLPGGIFDLRFPHGITMTDSIRGVTYRVDEMGNQISEAVRLGEVPPPSASDATVGAAVGSETKEEPQSLARWILPVSALLLFVTLIFAGVCRWKSKQKS